VVLGIGLLSLRWLPLLLWLPGLGPLARALTFALCTGFTFALGADSLSRQLAGQSPLALAIPAAQELAMGLCILLLLSTLWGALQAAAELLGWPTTEPELHGLLPSRDSAGAETSGSLTRGLLLCGTALFFAGGGLDRLVALVAKSYELLPLPGSELEPAPGSFGQALLTAAGTRLFALTLVLALPVLVPRLLAELTLALWTRPRRPAEHRQSTDAAALALRPLVWLLSLTLGAGIVLLLWLRQGPGLLHMLLLPAST
jgi:type III secretory pathway component EscT